MIAFLTLAKLRGIYLTERFKKLDDDENQLKTPRIILGFIYIFLALGVLFNFLIYLFIYLSNFFPSPMIFEILEYAGSKFYNFNRIKTYNNNYKYEFERTIYIIFALASFEAFLHLILTIWYLVNNNRNISNPRKVIGNLIWSLFSSITFGFLTFAPLFIQ